MLYAEELGATRMNSFQGLFWSYLALAVLICGYMTFVWFGWGKSFRLRSFAMTGAFLVFPLVCMLLEESCVSGLSSLQMLVGTVAFNTLRIIEPSDSNAFSIWVLGYMFQGLGMAIAFIFITVHFYRAIRFGFHRGAAANSTFVSVGPPGFTALAVLQLGSHGREILPIHTPLPREAADVIYYASIPMALCLTGVAMYCWVFAMLPWIFTSTKHIMYNPAGAWPLTFPCTGFIMTLGVLGDIFGSHTFWILHAVFTGYICLAFSILLPSWLYRIVVPPDPELLAARSKYFEEAYDHLNFWKSARLAEEAERQYFTTIANNHHEDENPVHPDALM
jgi:tellurite resistance protein TehA-like permease